MQAARIAADAFVELFREHVWRDFSEAGMPAERATSVRDSADTLLPFAAEAMLTLFNQVMASAVAADAPSRAR